MIFFRAICKKLILKRAKYKNKYHAPLIMTRICGIDEAGRGPVIGPMVLAGVAMEEDDLGKLKKLGVKDSKQHTPAQREMLFKKIISISDGFHIIKLSPMQIDRTLQNPDTNLNWLEADTSVKIISRLAPDKAVLDCPSTNIKAYMDYIAQRLGKKTQLVVEHKADENYPIVSAASILAKVTRDNEIKRLREQYGDLGSGYPSDPQTQAFIKKHHDLPIYRKTWTSWKRIEDEKNQRKLGDF